MVIMYIWLIYKIYKWRVQYLYSQVYFPGKFGFNSLFEALKVTSLNENGRTINSISVQDSHIAGSDIHICVCILYDNFFTLYLWMSFQVCVRVCGLLDLRLWLLVALCSLSILATAVWYVPFKLMPTWNCIVMRNQDVVDQPMTVETLPQRLLGEAQHFIRRWEWTSRLVFL